MDILKQSIATNVPMTELMQQTQVAETPEQQQEGLRNQPEGTSMAFPESTGNFNTVGMDYPINIQKVSPQGDLVRSYENVPPGVENLPMGDDVGTVIETPANYQEGDFKAQVDSLINTSPLFKKYSANPIIRETDKLSDYGGDVSFYPPGEVGPKGEVINPSKDRNLLTLYGRTKNMSNKEKLDLIKGDLMHSLTKDSTWKNLRNDVWNLRSDQHVRMDKNAYEGRNDGKTKESKGYDDRGFDQWADVSRKDALVRAYMMQYPNWQKVWENNPEMISKLEQMKQYLNTGEHQEGDFSAAADKKPIPVKLNNTFSDGDISEDKYFLPRRFKENRISDFGHALSLFENDVNTALGGVKHQGFPETKAQKDFQKGREVIGKKKQKFVESLNKRYGRNFEYTDMTQAERDMLDSYGKESDAFETSQLSKEANYQTKFQQRNSDPIRHTHSSALTANTLANKIKNIPYLGKVADFTGADHIGGFLGANLLGIGHEISAGSAPSVDSFSAVAESGKDIWNNAIGAYIGVTSDTNEEMASKIRNAISSGVTTSGKYDSDWNAAGSYQKGDFKEDNIVIQNAQKAADEKEDFTRPSKTYFPPEGKKPSSFAGKVIDMLPTSAKINIAKAQPYIEKYVMSPSLLNQGYKLINNLAGGTYDGNFKFPGGMPICYGNTCVQSTSEILQRSGKWEGKLEQDNDAFAKDYASHGYELVQEENALPGDIVQFYKGTYDNRDYSHMGIHGKDGKYFNDGYFDKPWHKKNEPTTAELMKNSKIPLNDKAIGKVYYRYKKE